MLTWLLLHPGWAAPVESVMRRFSGRKIAPDRPSIQRISADLRRLHTRMLDRTSAFHRAAVHAAYDQTLRYACAALDVGHHLDDGLTGLDRELERLIVEDALQRAGLTIR